MDDRRKGTCKAGIGAILGAFGGWELVRSCKRKQEEMQRISQLLSRNHAQRELQVIKLRFVLTTSCCRKLRSADISNQMSALAKIECAPDGKRMVELIAATSTAYEPECWFEYHLYWDDDEEESST